MHNRVKARSRSAASIRQSVTIPAQLAAEVRRVAKRKHLTMSRALVTLAEKGVEAEAAARENLSSAYQRFMSAGVAEQNDEAGKELIRAIFGRTAIAEDSVL
jgi:predicted DNA-binding ribbon-helix-helix protein